MAEPTEEELKKQQEEEEAKKKKEQEEAEEEERKKKEEEEKLKNQEDVTKIAQKLADEQLTVIKGKLDDAYKKVENLESENTKLKVAIDDGKKALIEKEGEYTKKLAEEKYNLEKENAILKEKLLNSERDQVVGECLIGLDFVNSFAKSQAVGFMKTQIKKDDNDQWVHSSGVPLKDYVNKVLVKEEDKAFWFKPKNTTGPSNDKGSSGNSTFSGSLLDEKGNPKLTTDEMLALAREGKLTMPAM